MTVAAYYAGANFISGKTDLTGRYALAVPPGSYRVLAYDDLGNFATGFSADAPSFEESPVTTVAAGQPVTVNLVLHLGGTVSGTVWPTTRVKAVVAAYNLSGTRRGFTAPDSQGAYSIVLPPGSYKIVAYDDNAAFAPSFFLQKQTFAAADPVKVAAGSRVTAVSFVLQIAARVTGVVTDTSNNPVANAVVLAYDAGGVQMTFAITAADGSFSMTVVPGTYRFVAIDPSFTFAAGFLSSANSFDTSQPVTIGGGQAATNLSFRLERGGEVSGVVLDQLTGAPLRNMTVAAFNADGTQRTFVTTDANGKYVLLLPAARPYRLAAFDSTRVYATQFHPQANNFAHATSVTTTPGPIATLPPFTLAHGGRFNGSITDRSYGVGVSGATVAAYDPSGDLTASGTSDQDGHYSVVVPAGAYRLIAFDPQLRYAPEYGAGVASFSAIAPVSVAADSDQPFNFSLQRGTVVSGTVVDRLHAPVGDIVVAVLDLNQNQVAIAITGSDGTFRVALVPGQYKLLAWDPNGRYASVYMGGTMFANATTINVTTASPPPPTVTVLPLAKRRAVQH